MVEKIQKSLVLLAYRIQKDRRFKHNNERGCFVEFSGDHVRIFYRCNSSRRFAGYGRILASHRLFAFSQTLFPRLAWLTKQCGYSADQASRYPHDRWFFPEPDCKFLRGKTLWL